MSYREFTLANVQKTFEITSRVAPLFGAVGSIAPSPWLKETLEHGKELAPVSEKARSEFIVAPVLIACRALFQKNIHVFSGIRLDVAAELGLVGECDFIIGRSTSIYVLQAPLLVILEAKKNDVEVGIGQCAAQMIGAQMFNERELRPIPAVFGCVTTGEAWQFLKLEGKELRIDANRYFINEPEKILWILAEIIKMNPESQSSDAA